MKRSIRPWMRGLEIFLCVYGLTGCDRHYQGSCDDDEDLRDPDNYYDGAICKDGQAACPDGRDFCESLQTVAGASRIVPSCDGPCMTCPDHGGACVFRNLETGQFSFLCVETVNDCWSNSMFLELDSYKKGCPRMDPSCF